MLPFGALHRHGAWSRGECFGSESLNGFTYGVSGVGRLGVSSTTHPVRLGKVQIPACEKNGNELLTSPRAASKCRGGCKPYLQEKEIERVRWKGFGWGWKRSVSPIAARSRLAAAGR